MASTEHYKPVAVHLEQITEYVAFRKKNKDNLQKNQRKDAQFPAKFEQQCVSVLEMLTVFESIQ